MKKYLILLFMMIATTVANAQSVIKFTGTSFAIAQINQITGTYNWSQWQKCTVNIYIDIANDVVTIYSNSPQRYVIVSDGYESMDNGGGSQLSFNVVDQDGDRGTLRLRIESNGNSQIYIDFLDVAWVYNVIRR